MITFEKIDSFDDRRLDLWDSYVDAHPQGTPFHGMGWLKAIGRTYDFKPFFCIWRNQEAILGVFPFFEVKGVFSEKRLISLPFSDYGGALFSDDGGLKRDLRKDIEEIKKSAKMIEVRGAGCDEPCFLKFNYYKSHVLTLEYTIEDLKKIIDKRTIQYSIRKAEKVGVEVRENNDQDGIDQFYHLNVLTRKKHGVPCQPKKFFENLLNYVVKAGRGFLVLAYYQKKPVGGGLFLTHGKTIHYKYNASDPDITGKVTPNHALTWHAISKGCKEGFQSLNFGRTAPDNTGLMRYKSMWGSVESDLPYYYYPAIKGAATEKENTISYKILTKVWRNLPYCAVESLSNKIYNYLT
jgi:CelD/BcsL family acetyltransferase involved in cellulose biosynthesis